MRRQLLMVGAALVLSSCGAADPIMLSPSGYDAIEFTKLTLVRDHAFNTYVFPAGRRFIADRRDAGGRPLFCGQATLNTGPKTFDLCIGFEAPNTLIIGPGAGLKEVRRPQPEGTIRSLKVNLHK